MHARIVQRNLLLAESIRIRAESDGRPQDVVKLYDDILKVIVPFINLTICHHRHCFYYKFN